MKFANLALLSLSLLAFGCSGEESTTSADGGARLRFAYITNGPDDFWKVAEAGVNKAKAEFDVDVTVLLPNTDSEQKQAIEDMIIRGLDGMAISPRNPKNQTDILNSAAGKMPLITQDSDAPDSNRLCFIGVNNYIAGRMCGELIKEAMPDGGKIAMFVAWIDQDNARLRRQGVIDELLDREHDASRSDPMGKPIVGDKYTIVGTFTDQMDRPVAKSNVEDAMTKHSDLGLLVGLFAYNAPMCLQALKGMNLLGKVKIIGFDEHDDTLQAIIDGHIAATVVQDPYGYGYESIKMLVALARGDESGIPANKVVDVPARKIGPDEVESFWTDLKKKVGADG